MSVLVTDRPHIFELAHAVPSRFQIGIINRRFLDGVFVERHR